jgi:hypothetical protein
MILTTSTFDHNFIHKIERNYERSNAKLKNFITFFNQIKFEIWHFYVGIKLHQKFLRRIQFFIRSLLVFLQICFSQIFHEFHGLQEGGSSVAFTCIMASTNTVSI